MAEISELADLYMRPCECVAVFTAQNVVAVRAYDERHRRWEWKFLKAGDFYTDNFGSLPHEVENCFRIAAYAMGISEEASEKIRAQEGWPDFEKTRTWQGYVMDRASKVCYD